MDSLLKTCTVALLCSIAVNAIDADEVKSFPGFDGAMPSKVFSGYIKASAPTPEGVDQTFYSHYVLTESQGSPATDPLVLWQQGGPGSSGFGFGYFAELGPYVIDADSLTQNTSAIPTPFINEHSWDHLSNLLLFEHPPGTGFSYCVDKDDKPTPCHWDDQSQAVAFYNTLTAFYSAYQDYANHDLYIIGESYAGLLIPFLVDQIVKHPTETPAKQLKSFAVGNGCPGTSGSTTTKTGTCNGPYGNYDTQHIFELAWGHSGLSRKLHDEIVTACNFPCKAPTWSEDCKTFSPKCEKLLQKFSIATGPFNIYNYFDNCGGGNQEFSVSAGGGDMESSNPNVGTFNELRDRFNNGAGMGGRPSSGGQSYPCGTGRATTIWCNNAQVREAIHMKPESFYGYPWSLGAGPSTMQYNHYTGASFDLYPNLLKHYRALIYNGDVDACVPYNSNEDWTVALATQEGYKEIEAWRPWLLDGVAAGYVTSYATPGPANFTFLTVKDSGHMVPQYQPARALEFFSRWLKGGPY